MGAECVRIFVFFSCCVLTCVTSYPVANQGTKDDNVRLAEPTYKAWTVLVALSFTISCVLLVFGCLSCCRQRIGFKEFRNSETNVNSVGLDFVNPLQNVAQPSRYSIFSSIAAATSDAQPDSIVTFEALPKLLSKALPNINVNDASFLQDWLGNKDFPRQQLHYLRECGQGWFGKVVEGEARGIVPSSNKVYKVVVRILKEDATSAEQAYFLQEVKPFRDLAHPNILKLLGKCVDNAPFLLVFETCSNGDLKSYLKQNAANRDSLVNGGVILKMSVEVAAGLSYMLQNGFVHTDIAARNCLVTGDLRIKVGDYGTSLQTYKDEYYFNGDMALPIRWCAPETLNCTETTIEPKQVTAASCIWSYGVLLWELEEWAELPYKELTDHQVLSQVFGNGLRLQCPENRTPYSQELYGVMTECWRDYVDRPSFIHVMNSLSALLHKFKSSSFDARWYATKPNCVAAAENDDKLHSRMSVVSSKYDSDSGVDVRNSKSRLSTSQLQQSCSRQRLTSDDCSSESAASSRRFSNSSAADLFASPVCGKVRSPSLENLHGSVGSLNRRCAADIFDDSATSRFGKADFRLGMVSSGEPSILWNNKPLFQSDSYLEDTSITRRIESLSVDPDEDIWRKRIERGEFTEKVKEKSKSVADLMILTHIDCSESSESDSLPSFHSRQSSFNRQARRINSKGAAACMGPMSLVNSLSFSSESDLPVVETDPQFQETLKKMQSAKISANGGESLNFSSLAISKEETRDNKPDHFLAIEASQPHLQKHTRFSSHCPSVAASEPKLPVSFLDSHLFDSHLHDSLPSSCSSENLDSVVLGPSENDTLEFFKGLKTTLVENEKLKEVAGDDEERDHSPRTLSEFLADNGEEYFYKCANSEEAMVDSKNCQSTFCHFCYDKCHFSNECLRSIDEHCSCESLEKLRGCGILNSCPFQSDDSGRGTDQINSGEGSGDKSLEGSISVQMNELKHRLEDVVAKITTEEEEEEEEEEVVVEEDASEDNCSSLEDDKDDKEVGDVEDVEEVKDEIMAPNAVRADAPEHYQSDDSSLKGAQSENDESTSADEDTCLDTVIDSTMSIRSAENEEVKSESVSEDNRSHASTTFVKVEQLFFSVDPKFEKEIEAELSRSFDSFSKSTISTEEVNGEAEQHYDEWTGDSKNGKDDENKDIQVGNATEDKIAAYELSDILEGLREPISLPYSVNEAQIERKHPADSEFEETVAETDPEIVTDNWLPLPIEDDDDEEIERRHLEMNESFINAIRNELIEKLPNCSSLAIVELEERMTETEEVLTSTPCSTMTIDYKSYPAQLSPIFEEDECSSMSTVPSLALSETSCSHTINNSSCPFDNDNDDLLVVDTETNEASMLQLEAKTSSSSMGQRHRLNETYDINESDDTIAMSDTMDSDSLPTPDSLSPASSSKSAAELSYSSSDCGNFSDVFLSPSGSSKNFDDFEMDKSLEDGRLLNTPEKATQYQRMLIHMDEMPMNAVSDEITFLDTPPVMEDELGKDQSENWLRALFSPAPTDAVDGSERKHFCSLPLDLESEYWTKMEQVTSEPNTVTNSPTQACPDDASASSLEGEEDKSDAEWDRTLTLEVMPKNERVEVEPAMAEKVYVSENDMSSSESSRSNSLKGHTSATKENDPVNESSPTVDAMLKNSIALFGNANKQIRNFQVSVVEDDCYLNNRNSSTPRTRAASEAYWSERFAIATSQDSEKTWKSPSNLYLGSPNMEAVENSSVNMSDLFMSTSFIENDSREGSIDENHLVHSDESDEEEGIESTSDEFVWKESDDIAQKNKKTDTDEDDDDDEELPEFIPFSWNCEAVPQKPTLRASDKIVAQKKNVSFKKQKYHCVYEYPKEKPNYACIYDNILHERMLNLWSVDRDYLYNNEYSSLSDWELEDCCDEQQTSNEEILPYNPNVLATSKANLSNKLGFYTIGVYDVDSVAKTEELVANNNVESSHSSSTTGLSSNGTVRENVKNSELPDSSNVIRENNIEDQKNKMSCTLQKDYASSLSLGELKHTKNRLKLDLNSPVMSYKSTLENKPYDSLKSENSDSDEQRTTSSNKEMLEDKFVSDYALNFNSCDISPVMELKSLASTSVA